MTTEGKKGYGKYIAIVVGVLIMLWQGGLYNGLVKDEANIKASHKRMFTSIDTMVKQIEGQGFVVANLRETLMDVIGTYVGEGGRGGNAGSAGFINAVSEAIPQVPDEAWNNMAATMNAAYSKFEASQNDKINRMASYEAKTGQLQYLLVVSLGGFPRIDMAEYGELVIGGAARAAKDTGVVETVNPFQK